jgi:hypothetical protein
VSADKSNSQWNSLCSLATELFPRLGSRLAAFKQACLERPELAAAAIDPTGRAVISGSKAAETTDESRGAVEADASGFGTAKPWAEIMRSLSAEAGEQVAEKPAGNQHGALPWSEVFRKVEAAERGGAR